MFAGLIGGLLLVQPVATAPGDATAVVVLPIVVDGRLERHYVERLNRRVIQGLSRSEFEVLPVDKLPARCEGPECAVKLAARLGAHYLVRTTVQVQERDYELWVELIDAQTGATVASRRQSCQLCGLGEVEEVLGDQAAALQTRIASLFVGPPRLTVTTDPPGATVFVDGVPVGTTPLARVLKPGRHWIEVDLEGRVSEQSPVVGDAGTHVQLAFDLRPIVPGSQPSPRSDAAARRAKAGWATFGVGAATIAAGVTLVAVHRQPNRLVCSGGNADADGDCKLLMNTRWPGVGVIGAGAAITAAGLGLVLATKKKTRRATVPSISIGRGRILVWGRF